MKELWDKKRKLKHEIRRLKHELERIELEIGDLMDRLSRYLVRHNAYIVTHKPLEEGLRVKVYVLGSDLQELRNDGIKVKLLEKLEVWKTYELLIPWEVLTLICLLDTSKEQKQS